MNKHFLLSVSDSKASFWGARFLGDFLHNKDDAEVTVYCSLAAPTVNGMPNYQERVEADGLLERRQKAATAVLQKTVDFLHAGGFRKKNLHHKLGRHSLSPTENILVEVEKGLYDALVLGRRGLGWLEELVESSVSRELLERKGATPVWLCRLPEKGRGHVLACVDDSPQTERMVDHVGFILADQPDHEITLLNIYDPNSEDRMFAEVIFDNCKALLAENNYPSERVHTRIVESFSPAKAILEVLHTGQYAAVAAGRTGEDRGLRQRLFMGSVSSTLFRQVQGAGLWLCH
jgi:nucleotide-binding universal stress UspA family protein